MKNSSEEDIVDSSSSRQTKGSIQTSKQSTALIPLVKRNSNFKQKLLNQFSIKVKLQPKSPGFTKKRLNVQPTWIPREIFIRYKIKIFGHIELEDFYSDFNDPFDENLIKIIPVRTVTRNNDSNEIQITLEDDGSARAIDILTITQHLKKFSYNKEYASLIFWLNKYQELVTTQQSHFNQLRHKLQVEHTLTQHECASAKQAFIQYVENMIKQSFSQDDFYVCGIYATDFEKFDLEMIRQSIGISYLELLGFPYDNVEQMMMRSLKDIANQSGTHRINQTITILSDIVTDKVDRCENIVMKTFDGLQLPVTKQRKIVYWDERPSWASKLDFVCILDRIDITAEDLQIIIQHRCSSQVNEIAKWRDLDYTLQAEMFVEKYYTNESSNQK